MKLSNSAQGIDMVHEDEKWWRHHRFPLAPLWSYRPAEGWNPSSWTFSWLFFRYWSLNQFSIEASFEIGWNGVGIGVILPYTRLWFWIIPVPLDRVFYRVRRKSPEELTRGY